MPENADPVLSALDELVAAGRKNILAWVTVMERADLVREARRRGVAYADMPQLAGPTIIESVSANQERLAVAGVRLRRAVVHQLHSDGMGQADIARLFGVSRQRIASLLREVNAPADGQ